MLQSKTVMKPPAPPKAVSVEVVAAQPDEGDKSVLADLSAQDPKALPRVTYLIKIRLKEVPEAASHGWALYLDDFRVPKYWEYKKGIYFKVFDPQFLEKYDGASVRFSSNGSDFSDTGLKFSYKKGGRKKADAPKKLPPQTDVLK